MRRKRTPNPAAFLLSLLITAALFGLILMVSGIGQRVRPLVETLAVFSVTRISAEAEEKRPPEQPVDQPEVYADSPAEASPSSRPPALAPAPPAPLAPSLTPPPPPIPAEMPRPQTDLARTPQSETPIAAEGLPAIAGAGSKGDRSQGATGPGGQGGSGIAGNGSGGAGKGNGTGSRLIAAWAPDMDFSLLHDFYPKAARDAGVEGAAWLSCFVPRFNEVRECKLIAETPAGSGFGKAALKAKRSFRIQVYNQSGRRMYNEWVTVRCNFILPDAKAREAATRNGAVPEAGKP